MKTGDNMEIFMSILKDLVESYSPTFSIEHLFGTDAIIITPDEIMGDECAMNDFVDALNSHYTLHQICDFDVHLGEELTDVELLVETDKLIVENGKTYEITVEGEY